VAVAGQLEKTRIGVQRTLQQLVLEVGGTELEPGLGEQRLDRQPCRGQIVGTRLGAGLGRLDGAADPAL